MSKRNSFIDTDLRTPLRRSARLLHNQTITSEPKTCKSKPTTNRLQSLNSLLKPHKDFPRVKASLDSALRRSPRLNNGVDISHCLRRSPRFSNKQKAAELVRKRTGGEDKVKKSIISNSNNKRKAKCEVGVGSSSCEQKEVIRSGVVLGLKALTANGERKVRDVVSGSEQINVCRKRKQTEEGEVSSKIRGWTKEQEVALQRAYFATKPTPSFWKKVSKLVPGKSAQDCFDKVHSDHVTPPQSQPQSRANKINSSALKNFSLSASKLLKPTELKIKRSSCNKRKSHLAQKMVRHLLQKNNHIDPGYEADLFSVLEPNINPSTRVIEQNGLVSTPRRLQEKQEFLQKCHERSSEHEKPFTKLSDSSGKPLVSPPVLKPVRNMALHEKYLDQLLGREAKRKAASARADRLIIGKENRGLIDSQKADVIRAAKNALVTDARNVITQLQHLNENSMSDSSDFCCDGNENDDDGDHSFLKIQEEQDISFTAQIPPDLTPVSVFH